MGYEELIASLRLKGGERVKALWRDAEEEAERLRREADEEIIALRDAAAAREDGKSRELAAAILRGADAEARGILAEAETVLAGRLAGLASEEIASLRREMNPSLFRALAREEPFFPWEEVMVNPADRDAAESAFPEARIVEDEAIIGGMICSALEGKLRLVNTLEKRLERIWTGLLPRLLRELRSDAG